MCQFEVDVHHRIEIAKRQEMFPSAQGLDHVYNHPKMYLHYSQYCSVLPGRDISCYSCVCDSSEGYSFSTACQDFALSFV